MNNNVIAGRYELIEKIGDGGMAVVYKAKCRLLKRFVAVKILKPEFTNDVKFIESFRRESHAAASLSHPNIVNIFDVGREGNINYIVMELVTGETLSEMIKREAPMDYRKAIEITKQIAAGLSAAHKHSIVHRDVKPHNILITEDGIAKITDFGIAKAVTNTTIVDKTNDRVMGSVHYFSPEQARGGYVDEKSDIYSLGIVLFEMLTGRVPFDGDNPVTIALMQINEEITPPTALVHGIPPRLEKIVLKATEKYPTKRFKSADEMIEALDNLELVTRVVGASVFKPADDEYMRKSEKDYLKNLRDYDDEDDDDDYKPSKAKPKKKKSNKSKKGKKNKLKIIIPVVAGILVIAIGLGLAFSMGWLGKKDIKVPDVKGMTFEEAESALEAVKLKIEVGEYVYSEDYKQDDVSSQDPEAGEMARKGQTVTVEISKGSEKGVVPNLLGKTEAEAKQMIEQYGYKLGDVKEKEGAEEAGTVLEQDPKAGEEAKPGDTINIVISDGKGKKEAEVPNLLGMDLEAAKTALENAGLKVGRVSEGVSDSYNSGEVMWQQYNSGTKLKEGDTVNIRVSQGQSSAVDIYVDFGSAEEEVFYMTVTVSDSNGTRNIITREQKKKADGGETIRVKGSGSGTITVIFDDKTVMKKTVNFSAGDVG
ncbi:MAG: Stk1 family PASTA domain-containing Ser/Thr kinase [Anaerovoracaceae bacterium]